MIIVREQMEYAFYWSDGGSPPKTRLTRAVIEESELGFGSLQQGLLFLRRFSNLMEFRQLLGQRYPGQVSRWRLDEIFDKLATELTRKRLRVIKRWMPAEGPIRNNSAPLVVPRRAPATFSEPPEPPTFLSNHNPEAQAETLGEAATDGEPFCEECEKARNTPRAFTGIPETETKEVETFNEDHDADTQSEALTTAGTDGTPFCEECEKLKAQAPKPPEEKKKKRTARPDEEDDDKDEPDNIDPEYRSKSKQPGMPDEDSEGKAPGPFAESGPPPIEELSWIEICLMDADGQPVPNVPYKLIDTRSDEHRGKLDSRGRARLDGIPKGSCQVSFPTLDQDNWNAA